MTHSDKPPPSKRQKTQIDDATVEAVWGHYDSYVSEQGDFDELEEIIELLQPFDIQSKRLDQLQTPADWVPVILSFAATCLCDQAVNDYLALTQSNESNDNAVALIDKVRLYLTLALSSFDRNASAWSLAANWGCMTQRLSVPAVAMWYEHAADTARELRAEAIKAMNIDSNSDSNDVRPWLESLILVQICGVEFEGDDDDDNNNDNNNENVDADWSVSTVESTSRFMAAMTLSICGNHDKAKEQLISFDLSHRLHPNIWENDHSALQQDQISVTNDTDTLHTMLEPCVFQHKNGVLPKNVYDKLCSTFSHNADYWRESDYTNRGYYSYFADKTDVSDNLIQYIISEHLLPLVKQYLRNDNDSYDSIVGYEWWTHTRPIQANLGHNLHFDTDEALLSQEQQVTHPLVSSVLYLTGESGGGATLVLDQSPDSTENAKVAWRCTPQNNTFLCFPGNLLHGVLPCPGNSSIISEQQTLSSTPNHFDLWSAEPDKTATRHRLTLMVGFWTRRVPDKMLNRRLYGPCGPLPPTSHAWVRDISQAIPRVAPKDDIAMNKITRTMPVWQELTAKSPTLAIPHALDHRYFVKNAPHCFRDSLFERDSDDEADDNDSEDGENNEESATD